jgi:murein DD-endopeptidase MepM/ murein hydrolase activator NlpD
VSLQPPVLSIGRTLIVQVTANRHLAASASLFSDALRFVQTPQGLLALVGVGMTTQPGTYAIPLTVTDTYGTRVTTNAVLQVMDADYGAETVVIPESRISLMSPDMVAQEADRLETVFSTTAGERRWEGQFTWPHRGAITTPFGMARTYNDGQRSFHAGVDIAGDIGAPVTAAATGQVALAEALPMRGNAVVIDHGWGVHTAYCHLSAIQVSVGQHIQQGQLLGLLGNTGLSTGPHLHWELRVGEVAVDPIEWVERPFPSQE